MNYSEPLVNQVTVFLRALGSGVILGIVYDVLCFFRMIFGDRKSVYVTFDILFAVAASVVSFFFMVLYNTGQVRLNLMAAELLGGVGFHLALGRYALKNAQKYISAIKSGVGFLFSPFRKAALKIISFFKNKLRDRYERVPAEKNIEKKEKKLSNIRNFLLKNRNKSV